MQTSGARPKRLFPTLGFITALLTVGLIIVGAIVRVSDSGLGCGNDWPLCNGTIFPPLDNLTAWIEWSHRLFAVVIGLFGIAMLVVAIRDFRRSNRFVLGMTIVAALLYAVQGGLGRYVVKHDLSPTLVTLHLGTAMLLLAALLIAAVAANYRPAARTERDNFTLLAYVTTGLSFVIILTGALVRGSGATLACTDWPLCQGEIFPAGQGQLAIIHMVHRYAVLALGVTLLILIWNAFTVRQGSARHLAMLAGIAYLAQAAIGALYVLNRAAPVWGAGHVLFAALTWAALVCLSLIETLNSRQPRGELEGQWQPRSEPIPN